MKDISHAFYSTMQLLRNELIFNIGNSVADQYSLCTDPGRDSDPDPAFPKKYGSGFRGLKCCILQYTVILS
jgi:hypothetical protein